MRRVSPAGRVKWGGRHLFLSHVLAAEDGSHVFATNVEEHDANVARARAQGLL